jgi:hypothetical protein
MKAAVAIAIVTLFVFAVSPVPANARTTTGHDQALTGCLESGSSAGHYKLVGQDGNTWNVKDGKYVDLASYVGKSVTVSGPEIRSHQMHPSTKSEGQLTVLDVAVDSQSCHQ